jgi:hypothetical protein
MVASGRYRWSQVRDRSCGVRLGNDVAVLAAAADVPRGLAHSSGLQMLELQNVTWAAPFTPAVGGVCC